MKKIVFILMMCIAVFALTINTKVRSETVDISDINVQENIVEPQYVEVETTYGPETSVIDESQKTTDTILVMPNVTPEPYEIFAVDEESNYVFVDSYENTNAAETYSEIYEEQLGDEFVNIVVADANGNTLTATYEYLYHSGEATKAIYAGPGLTGTQYSSFNTNYSTETPVFKSDAIGSALTMVTGQKGYVKTYTKSSSSSNPCSNQATNVACSTVQPYDINNSKMSYYTKNSSGELIYNARLSNPNSTSTSYSTYNLGPAPTWMQTGTKYYSYDMHYFYTSWTALVDDANSGKNATNSSNPYYNYYMTTPLRSESNFDNDFNESIASWVTSTGGACTASQKINGVYTKAGNVGKNPLAVAIQNGAFDYAEDNYGINKLLLIAVAYNESGGGDSNHACVNNNFFGAGVPDSCPSCTAGSFNTPADGVKWIANNYFSLGYNDPYDWRFHGGHLGDKASGINYKYASDPMWSIKAAANAYKIDSKISCNATSGCSPNQLSSYGFNEVILTKPNNQVTNWDTGSALYNTNSAQNNGLIPHVVVSANTTNYEVVPYTCKNSGLTDSYCGASKWNWETTAKIIKSSSQLISFPKDDSASSIKTEFLTSKFESDGRIRFDAKITYKDDVTGAETCLQKMEDSMLYLDKDGNLSTTTDQISYNNATQSSSNCQNWTFWINPTNLSENINYEVIAKLPVNQIRKGVKTSANLSFNKTLIKVNNSNGSFEINKNSSLELVIKYNKVYSQSINTAFVSTKIENDGKVRFETKITAINETTKKEICIPSNLEPQLILDPDNNLATASGQVIVPIATQSSSNCQNWIFWINPKLLVDNKEYYAFTKLPNDANNISKNQIGSVSFAGTNGTNTLNYTNFYYEKNAQNKLKVKYIAKYNKSIKTSFISTKFESDGRIKLDTKIINIDANTGKESCIPSNLEPQLILDPDNNLATKSGQVIIPIATRWSSNCQNWSFWINPKSLVDNKEYYAFAKLPIDVNNLSKNQTGSIVYTGTSGIKTQNYKNIYYAKNSQNKLKVKYVAKYNKSIKTSFVSTGFQSDGQIKVIAKITTIDAKTGKESCIPSNLEPQLILDPDNDFTTKSGQVTFPTAIQSSSNCQNWSFWINTKLLTNNRQYYVFARLPIDTNNASKNQLARIVYNGANGTKTLNKNSIYYGKTSLNKLKIKYISK